VSAHLTKSLGVVLVLALAPSWAAAQDLEFHAPHSATDASVPAVMRDLAERVLPVYQENDQDRYLANLSALKLVAGDYASAYATRRSLRERRRRADAGRPVGRTVLYDIYAHAKAIEEGERTPFAQAFAQSYREMVPRLNDKDAYAVTRWFGTPLPVLQDTLQRSFDQRRPKDSIALHDAVDLIWTYLSFDAYRSFGSLVGALDAEEDRRRYVTEASVLIRTPEGASLYADLIRPKNAAKSLPTLLEYTIDVARNDAKESAARGYVGVVAYARGTHGSPDKAVPFEHDGDDVRAVISWIARQPWSDGRVGMYGERYSGFAAWAAAKRLPPELKAIATSDPIAPGVDVPMTGNIFRNSAYRWVFDVTRSKESDEGGSVDDAQWRALDKSWYTSGRRYRELANVPGAHNAIFRRWLSHPSYDRYWQKMVPYGEEFASLKIPVLTTTGYYSGGAVGALYYFAQHYRYNPHANHTLLIGPYDEGAMARGPSSAIQGYQVDQTALIDLRELRYAWLDAVFKRGKKPPQLKDRVTYQVMGANEWRSAPTLEAMGKATLRFYLEPDPSADSNTLAQHKAPGDTFLPQNFDLAERSDADWTPTLGLVSKSTKVRNGEMFVSEPLEEPVEISGLFSGRLDFTANKMDMDVNIALYELLPGGEYLKLFDPSYEFRASYARDRVLRHLLRSGERQQLMFRSERMTSRRLQAGSRVVMVLGINKRPDQQINYGTGDDVSEESLDDAARPLKIRWYDSSYIDLPIRRLTSSPPKKAR